MENSEAILKRMILKKFIMPIVKEENGKKVVYESDLDELKLDLEQRRICIGIMKINNIEFKMNLITSKDRSPLVRDSEFGKVKTEGAEFRDVPRFAEVEYSDDEETLQFENYDELEEFLECEFLPNNITFKKKRGDKSGKIYPFIQWNALTKLKLSEAEYKHIMRYLEDSGIYVRGKDSSLDGEFENYDFYVTYKNIDKKLRDEDTKVLPADEQKELFIELKKTGNEEIREKLILSNMKLANKVAYDLARSHSIEFGDDIKQLAYEGLIKAVDYFNPEYKSKYDSERSVSFSTYATTCIWRHIMRNHISLENTFDVYNDTWHSMFRICRDVVEKNNGCSIVDDESLIEEVVDLMQKARQEARLPLNNREDDIQRIKMYHYNSSYEDLFDELPEIEDYEGENKFAEYINSSIAKEHLNRILDTLTSKEKRVLELRYGLTDGIGRTLEEVGREFNVSGTRIRQIEAKALRRMRHPSRSKPLKDYLELSPRPYSKPQESTSYRDTTNNLQKVEDFIRIQYEKAAFDISRNHNITVKECTEIEQKLKKEFEYYRNNYGDACDYLYKLRNSSDPESKKELEDLLSIFAENERLIISMRNHLNDSFPFSELNEICDKLGIDENTVYTLYANIAIKLSHYYHYHVDEKDLEEVDMAITSGNLLSSIKH